MARLGDHKQNDFVICNQFGDPLVARALQDNIKEYGIKAGIPADIRVSPHTFRHTFAVSWIKNHGGLFELQRIGGWSSLEIVKNYVNLVTEDIISAHREYSPADRFVQRSNDKSVREYKPVRHKIK